MNKDGTKKKAAPVLEHQGGQDKVGATAWQAGASPCNDTTVKPPGQAFRVADLLLRGQENGQTITDLERLIGCRSREIRKQIELERRGGALIISDNRNGYYLTDDPAEAQRFAQSMRHRAAQIRQTATAVEKAAGLL